MVHTGWAALGGMEIISNARVAAYAHGPTVSCQCPTLPQSLGDNPYRHPALDPAPWFEKHVPESADFWGVLGLEIKGTTETTLSTTFTDLINDGALPASMRRGAREIECHVMLLAGTEAGLSYGISWLNSVLRGSACRAGCEGDELCLLAACPEPPRDSATPLDCSPMGVPESPERAVPHPGEHPGSAAPPPNQRTPDSGGGAAPAPAPAPAPPAPEPAPAPAPPPPPAPAPAPAPPPPAGPVAMPPAPPGPPAGPNPPSPDPEVARTTYLVGQEQHVSDKVMLSSFETLLVESGCRNLDHGDRDSVGAFQQRPSAGWGSKQECMNVNHAAHSYFAHAKDQEQKHPEMSAGQLAQKVQGSAHPDRYDKKEKQARDLLDATARDVGVPIAHPPAQPQPIPPGPPPPTAQPQPLPGDPAPKPPSGDGHPPYGDDPQGEISSGGPHHQHGAMTTPPDPEEDEDGNLGWNAYDEATRMLRHLYNVSLLEFGSQDENRSRAAGAWTCELTFTLKAGNPGIFHEPVPLVDSRKGIGPAPLLTDQIPDFRIDAVADCPQPSDCLAASPYLVGAGPWGPEPFPGGNPADPAWRDPGYPTTPFDASRIVYDSPAGMTPSVLDKVPVIEVYAGGTDLHRSTVRFYDNPHGGRPTELDPCDALAEITLPWIPAKSKVRLDGRRQHVIVVCPDKHVQSSDVVLYGPLGTLVEWPVFDCGQALVVELIAQSSTIAPDAWLRLSWSARADGI